VGATGAKKSISPVILPVTTALYNTKIGWGKENVENKDVSPPSFN